MTPTAKTPGHDESILNALQEISRTGKVPKPPQRPEPPKPAPAPAPISISSTVIQAQLDAETALLKPISVSTGVFISTGPAAPPRPVYAIAVSSPTAPSETSERPPITLAQIQILGLEKVLESQIRRMINAREWEAYSAKDEAEDLAALEASGWFSRVSLRKVILSSATARLDIHLSETKTPRIRPAGAPSPEPALDILKAAVALGAAEPDIPTPPWVLGEIVIQGQQNVKRSVIRRQIQGRKGDLYGRADHDRDLRRILNLGNFERVVTDIEVLRDQRVPAHFAQASESAHPIKLTFLVEEKPIIDKILYAGRERISKGRLRDELSMVKRDPFDRTKMREDSAKILALYQKRGFHRAAVKPAVQIDTATLKAVITYRIEEGPRSRIKAVRFTGVTLFKKKSPEKTSRKLARKAGMKNRRKKRYSAGQLKADFKAIEDYYKNRGYLDYELKDSSVTFSPDGKEIFIDIDIHEGRAYRYGETTFSGQMIYASTELAKAVDYRRGKIFSQERFDRTMQGLRELYAEKGRLRAQISPTKTFNEESDLMDVHFAIRENDPVYIDHIDVEGNKTTKTYVFMRELAIKPGQLFSVSKIRRSEEKIRNLGFIDDVQLDIQSPYDPNLVDLTFEVFEGKPGMLTAGAGFSSLDGLIGTLSLQHLNVFGRAQRASVQWSFGSRVNDFSLSWTTPWVANKPVSLGFDVFNTRRVRPFEGSGSAFTSKRTGGTVRVGPRFEDDKYQLSFRYTFQKIKVADVEQRFIGTLSEGTSVSSVLTVEFARDTRDNIWDPTRGSRNSLGISLSGGPVLRGNIHFFKPFFQNALHHTLFKVNDYPFVLSISNRAGYVTAFNETREVPVFERFFIGGQDSLRGYSITGEVGARNGGTVYDVFNIEFSFPMARERRRTIVKFVTFFDAGGSWATPNDMRLRVGPGEQDIKTDVGFGIRFTTPAFPIRLDWGYGLNHRPGESKTQINFGIGSLF